MLRCLISSERRALHNLNARYVNDIQVIFSQVQALVHYYKLVLPTQDA